MHGTGNQERLMGVKEEKKQGVAEPGVVVSSVEVSFFAQSTPQRWREFMVALGCRLEPKATPLHWETELVALPEILKKGDRFLTGEVHPLLPSPEETHWVLKLQPVPSPTPPQELIDMSRQLGGYPGILERISDGWPAERRIEVRSKVSFILDEKKWRSPFAPKQRMALKPVSSNGHRAVLSFENYSWEFDSPGPLRKVNDLGYVDEGRGLFALSCSGQDTLELEPEMLSRVEVTLWQLVRGFLKAPPRRRPKTGVAG